VSLFKLETALPVVHMHPNMVKLFILGFSVLFCTVVHANPDWRFTRGNLPKNELELSDWKSSIARIEIVSDSTRGTNGALPTVTLRVLEILRDGNAPASDTSGLFHALWLSDPAGGANWQAHKSRETLDAWNALPVISPPTGTQALVFIELQGEMRHLSAQRFFPDTEANRQTALFNSAKEPLLSRLSSAMLVAIALLPLVGLGLVARFPRLAVVLAFTIWPIYWVYESQISSGAMFRSDLLLVFGAMVGSGLVLLAALLLPVWRQRTTHR
jgi:hypothetical protein